MDIDHVMFPIVFDVQAEIDADTPKIMHLESLVHLIPDHRNEVLVRNDEQIIDVQNDCPNDHTVIFLVMEQEQFLVNI